MLLLYLRKLTLTFTCRYTNITSIIDVFDRLQVTNEIIKIYSALFKATCF